MSRNRIETTAAPDDYLLDIPNERRAALLYTLKCNYRCSHCLVASSPERGERMSAEAARQIVDDARRSGIEVIYLTGGEVFLYWKQLLELVEYIHSTGCRCVVETNGYWARSDREAERRLTMLADRGMDCVALSMDVYHREEEGGLERSIRIAEAARRLDIPCRVHVIASPDPAADATITAELQARSIPYFYEGLMTIGRGQHLTGAAPVTLNLDCDSIGWTVLPDGDVFGCFGASDDNELLKQTPLYAGNAFDDPETFRSERTRLFAKAIDQLGHEHLVALLRERPGATIPDRESRDSICSFCKELLSDEANVAWLEEQLRELTIG